MTTRATIRSAAVAALTGATAADARVYASRRRPIAETDDVLPCLCVYMDAARLRLTSLAQPHYERSDTLVVVGYVSGRGLTDAELDDAADALADEVRDVLLTGALTADGLRVTEASDEFDVDAEANVRLASVVQRFTIEYAEMYEPAAAPPDDFLISHLDTETSDGAESEALWTQR